MKRLFLAICLLSLAVVSGHALTPAGTELVSQAALEYPSGIIIYAEPCTFKVAQIAGAGASLPAALSGQAGKTISTYLQLTNLGNGPDSFQLTRFSQLGWTINSADYVGVLQQDEVRQVAVSITLPSTATGQTDTISITAQSLFDQAATSSAATVVTATKPKAGGKGRGK